MAETLTESFCERCGTRYEFKAPTRLNPLRKTRGLFGGLKNYLTSQDDLGDAIGDAMRSEEDALAAAQLEAFHESFNFCIECRQYTCLNCWNDEAGRCRTCAPVAGTDDLAERLAAAAAGATPVEAIATQPDLAALEAADLQRRLGLEAWPTSDLPEPAVADARAQVAWPEVDVTTSPYASTDRTPSPTEFERPLAEPAAEPTPEHELEPVTAEAAPEPELEPEPMVAEAEPEPEPVLVEAMEPEPEQTAEAAPEPEPVLAEAMEPEPEPVLAWEPVALEAEEEATVAEPPRLLHVVAWDEDAALELTQPEPIKAEAEPEPIEADAEPEPMVAEAEPEPEPIVAEVVENEPAAAAVEPPPTAGADASVAPRPPRIAPISETILRFPSERTAPSAPSTQPEPTPLAAEDESPDVAARRAQLDLLGLGDPGEGPVTPQRPAVLPYRSRGAAAPVQGTGFWEASAREVASAPANIGVQSCGECGLSLSANARFCRRCGTRQARSA
ncbi:MAG TPA: hypothetical protein VHQ42_03685 [Candidatus Limnocylindria bacterium]|nr:hypothetical protein [Candidatus Limnocylindria bacterium]